MAINPIAFEDDFSVVVAGTRQEIISRGEHRVAASENFASPLSADEREAVMRLLRDGTYADAVARVADDDPDLADQ